MNPEDVTDNHRKPGSRRSRLHSARRNPRQMRLNFKRMGRELAMQFLFQCDLTDGEQTPEMQELFWEQATESGNFPNNRIFRRAQSYAARLLAGIQTHEAEIQDQIARLSEKWDFDRISAVDRNILRVAIYEMKYCPEIPPVVSIDEAIEIAKAFSSEKAGYFINGILNRVKEELPKSQAVVLVPEQESGSEE